MGNTSFSKLFQCIASEKKWFVYILKLSKEGFFFEKITLFKRRARGARWERSIPPHSLPDGRARDP